MRYAAAGLLVLVFFVGAGAQAGTLTLQQTDGLVLHLQGNHALPPASDGAIVQGTVTLVLPQPLAPGQTAVLVLDDNEVQPLSTAGHPRWELDTRQLAEGLHELRLEITNGTRLAMSSGTLPLHVANQAAGLLPRQARRSGDDGSAKAYRKAIKREIVWFDGREADLEKHGFVRQGRTYITLTDLVRHIGGNLTWGPKSQYIMVERSGLQVRVMPGASYVLVNGQRHNLGYPCPQIDSRTYVPLRPMIDLFKMRVHWNQIQRRALVAQGRP